jgi:hypothetical protein
LVQGSIVAQVVTIEYHYCAIIGSNNELPFPLLRQARQTDIDGFLPVVLRKRSNASGAGGAAEAKILKWLYARECPWYRRSGRESDATKVEAVEEIKYFDIFARIASFAAVAARSPAQGMKLQALESRMFRVL